MTVARLVGSRAAGSAVQKGDPLAARRAASTDAHLADSKAVNSVAPRAVQ